MIEPNVLAFQNAALLEAIEDAPNGQWTAKDLAIHLGRDDSNTGKTLRRLKEEGLLQDPPLAGLTDEGRAQLSAYKRAKHGGERRRAKGRWPIDKLRRNPLNRKIDPESVLGLADTIGNDGVGDILMPLVLSPPDDAGVRTIWAGERRWVAATRLLQLGELPEALLEGVPFVERPATPGEAAIIAVIENTSRSDLTPWEDANMLWTAAKELGLDKPGGATELARRCGRARDGDRGGLRDVQVKLKTVREATPEAIASYEANPEAAGAWERLRDSVSKPRPQTLGDMVAEMGGATLAKPATAAEAPDAQPIPSPEDQKAQWESDRRARIRAGCDALSPKVQLVLLETADKVLKAPFGGSGRHITVIGPHWPDKTGASSVLVGTIGAGFGSGGGEPDTVSLSDVSIDWLREQGWLTDDGALDAALFNLRTKALGLDVAAKISGGRYWTPWLNLEAKPETRLAWRLVETMSTPWSYGTGDGRSASEVRIWENDGQWVAQAHCYTPRRGYSEATVSPDQDRSEPKPALSRAFALAQACKRIRQFAGDELEDRLARWTDQIQGPFFVNGIDHTNASRAGEARRAAGLEPRQSNSGGGSSTAPAPTVAPVPAPTAHPANAVAAHSAAIADAARSLPSPLQAALEEVIEAVDNHLAGARREWVELGHDLEAFDDDADYLLEILARAEEVIAAEGIVDRGAGETLPRPSIGEPAVPVRQSIKPDHIVCLEDGLRFVGGLKRHLRLHHDLTPEQYRDRWKLPADYPMVAPNFAKVRHDLVRDAALRGARAER